MDKQFDELSKSLAEGVSRREALRKFGIGLAAVLLAAVGLNRGASAQKIKPCSSYLDCTGNTQCCNGVCIPLFDNNNCGYCGNVCRAGELCKKVKNQLGQKCGGLLKLEPIRASILEAYAHTTKQFNEAGGRRWQQINREFLSSVLSHCSQRTTVC